MRDVLRPPLLRYGVAVGAAAFALLLKLALHSLIGTESPFLLCFAAVTVSAWYGGLGPGLLTTALTALGAGYSFSHPVPPASVAGMGQSVRLGIFLAEGLLISLVSAAVASAQFSGAPSPVTDVSERQQAEHSLQESEQRYREKTLERFHRGLQGERQNFETAITHRDGRRIELSVTAALIVVDEEVGVYGIVTLPRVNAWASGRAVPATCRVSAGLRTAEGSRLYDTCSFNVVPFTWRTVSRQNASRARFSRVVSPHGPTDPPTARTDKRAGTETKGSSKGAVRELFAKASTLSFIGTRKAVPGLPTAEAYGLAPGGPSVTVRDTGIGIEPEVLPHVFETFTQADRTLDRSRGGLGLGLALVQRLVEMHGGEVWAESEGLGRGAAFTFWLPLERQPTPSEEAAAPAGTADGARRILVVEDNRDAAETLRELLELFGHTVEVAYSGSAGVEAARAFQPEVVLCDLGLPGMDGYAVAAELRREPATASARLIAVSGYGQDEDRYRSREAGFDVHLTKPVDLAELERLVTARAVGS